ncbi:hypothetical protein [Piscinibacter koreensis]|uniref:DUF2783 domain-containing protein n=1 Tax=Piscinibacter koreensis TaxID=2742824 RepID=A0A7Y6TYP8_9BURK|nr:hypothetical protein [Schlegelella koreensis]NUZ08345.1 hypothetical protein [Schlegelella koreensis]
MLDNELDAIYTRLCTTMTALGEADAPLFLARFALLATVRIGDADVVSRLVDEAARNLTPEVTP